MPYGIELSFNNKEEGIELPVMPEALEVSKSGNSKSYDVVALGEINVIKNPKLTDYGFSSFFPYQRYPFITVQNLLKPIEYTRLIIKWMVSGQPIRFVFISDSFEINTLVSIESFNWKERAGGAGDIDYDIKLKRYAAYAAKRASLSTVEPVVAAAAEVPARPNETQQPKTYTLVSGDTLWAVAKQFLGDGARWLEIQKLNGITEAEIRRLQIGRVLNLP